MEMKPTSIKSSAICMKSLSTFSASFAEVSKKYILCRAAKSSPTCVGISRSSLSILLPTMHRYTLTIQEILHKILQTTTNELNNNKLRLETKNKKRDQLFYYQPTRILSTLLLAYSSISLNQSGKQSNVG